MRRRELQAARQRLGLSQEALAKALVVTRAGVARWEGGSRKVPTMVALAIEALEKRSQAASKSA